MPTQSHTRVLALRLFDELGRELLGESLTVRGWTFGFDRARRRLGVCRPRDKRITLSAHLSRTLPPAEVEDTVRHEIAHALDHELHPSCPRPTCPRPDVEGARPPCVGRSPSGALAATSPTTRPRPTSPSARRAASPATSTASPSAPTSAGRALGRAGRPTSASHTSHDRPGCLAGRYGARTLRRYGLASRRRAPAAAIPSTAPAVQSARPPAPRAAGATLGGATTSGSASASTAQDRDPRLRGTTRPRPHPPVPPDDPTAPPPVVEVGTLAVAVRDTAVCRAGEVGVCYDVYKIGGRPGYAFLFQDGGYDGFSPSDIARFLEVQPARDAKAATYAFRKRRAPAARLRAQPLPKRARPAHPLIHGG